MSKRKKKSAEFCENLKIAENPGEIASCPGQLGSRENFIESGMLQSIPGGLAPVDLH